MGPVLTVLSLAQFKFVMKCMCALDGKYTHLLLLLINSVFMLFIPQRIDVTEAQFLHMCVLGVSSFAGTNIWLNKVNTRDYD